MTKTIGFLGATNPLIWSKYVGAFAAKLASLGNTPSGETIAVSYKWAEGNTAAYRSIAQQFVNAGVDAIVTSGTEPVRQALSVVPATMQIFFASAGERFPNGNVHGTWNEQTDRNLTNRRFLALRQIFGQGATVAVLGNYSMGNVQQEKVNIDPPNGVGPANQLNVVPANIQGQTPSQIAATINALNNVAVLYVCTDPLVTTEQEVIITTAFDKKLPTMFAFREYVENGGLMSIGPDFSAMFVTAATNVHDFLSGRPPHRPPIAHTLVINKITRAHIGLTIPSPPINAQTQFWP
jgi:putative ABC transport system substrate-binding protein